MRQYISCIFLKYVIFDRFSNLGSNYKIARSFIYKLHTKNTHKLTIFWLHIRSYKIWISIKTSRKAILSIEATKFKSSRAIRGEQTKSIEDVDGEARELPHAINFSNVFLNYLFHLIAFESSVNVLLKYPL